MRILFLLVVASFSFSAAAYFQMDMMNAKREAKQATQWTLADWLTQKNKMSLMDHWLAMNTSQEWFELNLGGGAQQFELKKTDKSGEITTTDQHGQAYHADIYLSLLNLYGEYEKTDNDREAHAGAAGLRILGTTSQTTNLIARYGWRKLTDHEADEYFENQFAEGQLQFYLISAFGLQGKYRHYLPHDSNKGTKLEGHRATGGAFLEFLIFRLYADYYKEPMELTDRDDAVKKEERSGIEGGLKLFF